MYHPLYCSSLYIFYCINLFQGSINIDVIFLLFAFSCIPLVEGLIILCNYKEWCLVLVCSKMIEKVVILVELTFLIATLSIVVVHDERSSIFACSITNRALTF